MTEFHTGYFQVNDWQLFVYCQPIIIMTAIEAGE